MHWFRRSLILGSAAAAMLAFSGGALAQPGQATTPRVTIYDNDAPLPNQGYDPAQAQWGYGPMQIAVQRGESVVFSNPTGNRWPHTITSVVSTGPSPYNTSLAVGTLFDSSPESARSIRAGQTWTLETADLEPGHYLYYCRLHPWMVGVVSVNP